MCSWQWLTCSLADELSRVESMSSELKEERASARRLQAELQQAQEELSEARSEKETQAKVSTRLTMLRTQ